MKNLDSLTLKYFFEENKDFIKSAIVQKIQLPTRYEIILNIRAKNENKKLYININPKYPHICFIDETSKTKRDITIPKNPPMFCMQLRKYLSGSKIKDFRVVDYERIVELYFDYFDEIGSLTRLCLCFELMGKYSNIILYNAQNRTIIGSMHNVSSEKSANREIYGGIKYTYPCLKSKLDILKTSYAGFFELSGDIKTINDNFYYFTNPILEKIFELKLNKQELFNFLQELQNLKNTDFIKEFWDKKPSVNESIDSYFSNLMFEDILKNKKSFLKKILLKDIKKLNNIVSIKPDNKPDILKQKADLLMANIYSVNNYQTEVVLDGVRIELEKNLSVSKNAQKYYSLYKKALSTNSYRILRQKEAKEKLDYFESIVFNIENASLIEELEEIKEELSKLNLIKKENIKTNKTNINKIIYKNYEIYIGKNNIQNDYLISKVAKDDDLWFHGQNFPSSHIILKVPNNKKSPDKEVLEFCAKLTKENSKAKNSGKTPIIYTKRKNLKKPPNTYPGYVTYKNESEIVI